MKGKERSRRYYRLSSLRLEGQRLRSLGVFRPPKDVLQQPRGPVAIALVLWLLFFAANAFAMFKPPYPQKAQPPGQIIVVGDRGVDSIAGTATKAKSTIPGVIKK